MQFYINDLIEVLGTGLKILKLKVKDVVLDLIICEKIYRNSKHQLRS